MDILILLLVIFFFVFALTGIELRWLALTRASEYEELSRPLKSVNCLVMGVLFFCILIKLAKILGEVA